MGFPDESIAVHVHVLACTSIPIQSGTDLAVAIEPTIAPPLLDWKPGPGLDALPYALDAHAVGSLGRPCFLTDSRSRKTHGRPDPVSLPRYGVGGKIGFQDRFYFIFLVKEIFIEFAVIYLNRF